MIRSIALLLSLYSAQILANKTCFEIDWRTSFDSGTSAKQKDYVAQFVNLNNSPIDFYTVPKTIGYHSNGNIAHSISRGCAGNNLLNVGDNHIYFAYQVVGISQLTEGWQECSLYMISGKRKDKICRSLLLPNRPANDSCSSQFSRTLEELNPQLAAWIRDLEKSLSELQRFSKTDEFKQRFQRAEELLAELRAKDFSQLSEADYAIFQRTQEIILNLKKDIEQLKQEIKDTQSKIGENLQNKSHIILDELKREGFENFEIPSVDLKVDIREDQATCSNDRDNFDVHNNIYKNYADKILESLESDLKAKDRINFLKEVQRWTATIPTFEQIALNRGKFSKKEWDTYKQQYELVSKFIDQHVDKDLWFKDSPVPEEIRLGLREEIREVAPTEANSLESVLKQLGQKELTPEQQRGIEIVQILVVMAKGIVRSAQDGIETMQEFRGFVKETAEAISKGAKCLSQAQVRGRLGSLYELFSGKDQCNGEELSEGGRIFAGVELVLGAPKVFKLLGAVVGIGVVGKNAAKFHKAGENLFESAKKFGLRSGDQVKNIAELSSKAKIDNLDTFLSTAAKHSDGSVLIFKADKAVEHFAKHGGEVMNALSKSSYNLKEYMLDAHHVVKNGQYVPEMNGYVRLIGGSGSAKAAFVGMTKDGINLTTMHIKTVSELKKKAPSLGWE